MWDRGVNSDQTSLSGYGRARVSNKRSDLTYVAMRISSTPTHSISLQRDNNFYYWITERELHDFPLPQQSCPFGTYALSPAAPVRRLIRWKGQGVSEGSHLRKRREFIPKHAHYVKLNKQNSIVSVFLISLSLHSILLSPVLNAYCNKDLFRRGKNSSYVRSIEITTP